MDRIQASGFADRISFHFDDGPPEQKMNAAAVLAGASPGSHLYVCGPQGFMDAVIGAARAAGWPEARIHREYFSAAAGAAGDGRARVADRPFDVKIASTGRLIHVPAGETVVAALARRGVHIPTSCSQGLCGTCLTRVIAGEPEHRDKVQSDAERACNDQLTPCCSRSRSPLLVLDL